jgi:hypothetical protein
MKQRCRRAEDLSFAYDCGALTSALLTALESESRFSMTPLGQKVAAQREQRSEQEVSRFPNQAAGGLNSDRTKGHVAFRERLPTWIINAGRRAVYGHLGDRG